MKKVACFFTCGYTEMDAMRGFIQRVHPGAEYTQLCPNRAPRTRRAKDAPPRAMIEQTLSGLTGQALLDYAYNYMEKNRASMARYDAVLIEDDLDYEFFNADELGSPAPIFRKREAFEAHCKTVRDKVHEILDAPVILLYASPEIEMWFLADWENTFGNVFGPKGKRVLKGHENEYFSVVFKDRVWSNVLAPYTETNMEHYCAFDKESGKFKKFSKTLEQELEDFKRALYAMKSPPFAPDIGQNASLRYSKSIEGDIMLRNLNPDALYNTLNPDAAYDDCPVFFRSAVDELRKL